MRAPLLVALSLLAAGCASPGGVTPQATSQTVRVNGPERSTMGISTLQDAQSRLIAAPLDEVWRVLPLVLDSLGVPVTTRDPATGRVGNTGMAVHRMLGGTIVSRYFTCAGNVAGQSAVSFDLFVVLTVHVETAPPAGTALTTSISTRGKPISTSGDWIPCESTGLLEKRIADRVEAKAAH